MFDDRVHYSLTNGESAEKTNNNTKLMFDIGITIENNKEINSQATISDSCFNTYQGN